MMLVVTVMSSIDHLAEVLSLLDAPPNVSEAFMVRLRPLRALFTVRTHYNLTSNMSNGL